MAERGRGRPKGSFKDPAALKRALELLDAGEVSSPQEAAEHPDIKGRAAWRTIYDALERRRKEQQAATPASAPIVLAAVPVAPAVDVLAEPEPLTPERERRADLIRRMAADGLLDHEAAGRLLVTPELGLGSEAEALTALHDADRVAAARALPPHLAREASLGTYRRLLKKAEDANDWKSATMVQTRIDTVQQVGKAPAGGDGVPRERVAAFIKAAQAALAPWPEALAAFKALGAKGGAKGVSA